MHLNFLDSDGSGAKHGKYIKLLVISGLVLILDQLTKLWIIKNLPLYHSITVIPGFFNITHILNPGGAFGFLAHQNSHFRNVLFLLASSIKRFIWGEPNNSEGFGKSEPQLMNDKFGVKVS